MKDLVDDSWFAGEYAEGSVFGVMLDAWLRELGPDAAAARLAADGPGMPQAEELLDAAERAGLQYWGAYPSKTVDIRALCRLAKDKNFAEIGPDGEATWNWRVCMLAVIAAIPGLKPSDDEQTPP